MPENNNFKTKPDNKRAADDEQVKLTSEFLYSIWNFFAANLSERTRKNYYNIVKNYVKITEHSPENLTHSDTDKYFNELVTRMNAGKITRSTAIMRLSVMKTLCDYISYKKRTAGELYTNFFADYAIPEKDKMISSESIPSDDEINCLFEYARKNDNDTLLCILALTVKCGLTTSELCRLTDESILYDKKHYMCLNIRETRKVSRIIKLPSDVSRILKKYLKKNIQNHGKISEDEPQFMFYNKRGTNLKPRDAERLLKQCVDTAIYDNKLSKAYTLQDMRHSAIKYMLMGRASDDEVAAYCGITTKWLPRYERVVADNHTITSADYSVISIHVN